MSDTTALRTLIEAVEAGKWSPFYAVTALGSDRLKIDAKRAFDGSVDAALALMEAVLPGVPVALHDMTLDYLGAQGWVAKINWPHTVWQPTFTAPGPFAYEGRADTPARALLLAILKAVEATTAGKE